MINEGEIEDELSLEENKRGIKRSTRTGREPSEGKREWRNRMHEEAALLSVFDRSHLN